MPDMTDQNATGHEAVDDGAIRDKAKPQELNVLKGQTKKESESAQRESVDDRDAPQDQSPAD